VVVIDRRNYHLFVPLLYQVATAALSPADIARPIRRMLARYPNVDVMLDKVTGIDVANRRVILAHEAPIVFRKLVVATGSTYSYFGHDDWASAAPGPKTIEDARTIRTRLLLAFERAEISGDANERARLLTTVIIGGGPTGVEMAGAVAELARNSLARDFRHIDPTTARILLVEAGDRILGGFPETLSTYAAKALTRLGVTVMTGARVEAVAPDSVTVNGGSLPAGTVIWGAGVQASGAAKWLGVTPDRAGRIAVAPDLSVIGLDGIYALGDTAACPGEDGKPLPALAQVAHQQGLHLGKALRANLADGRPLPPFRFRNRGNTAVIGRNAAVFDFGWLRLKGRLGWLLWALVHIYLLTGFEKRFLVASQWLWSYITYQSGARLITGGEADRAAE
jgi:NADH:ubiquinone reductase (H+-translocating)